MSTAETPPARTCRVVICVITLGRPKALAHCLAGISALEPPDEGVTVSVVIIDNDPAESARAVVDQAREACAWNLEYRIEPIRGIPHARNLGLAYALDTEADYVGFIDDDESPRPGWLRAMMRQLPGGADVLMGPSVPVFAEPPAKWIVDGGFFERRRFATGEVIPYDYARTSGVLIASKAIPPGPEVFDERFRYSGGSDLHLFRRMQRAGSHFAWVDDAVVDELVPASRATASWLVLRAYRIGNTRSKVLVADGVSPWRRARRAVGAVALTAVHASKAIPGLRRGRPGVVRVAQTMADGAGLLTGVLGISYGEYRRIHGS